MPHTPEHIASTTSPTDIPPPEPLPRHGESLETMRARLVYQSRKRGTLESDLLLSTFAQEHLSTMNAEELSEFDKVRAIYIQLFFFVLMR
jgi:succinate dehydrogenase assembly factor 2